MRWFHTFVAVLIASLVSPTHAETATSIKSKTAEITVKVEDALKKYPALFDNCAAERKVWAAKAQEEANREVRELPQGVPTFAPWTYERTYKLRSAIGPYISVLREDYTNTGGAHRRRLHRLRSLDRSEALSFGAGSRAVWRLAAGERPQPAALAVWLSNADLRAAADDGADGLV